MNVQEAYEFTSKERLAVRSAVTDTGPPQSAFAGHGGDAAIGNYFRHGEEFAKYPNLKKIRVSPGCLAAQRNLPCHMKESPRELAGEELAKYKKIYFGAFPDGPVRESWPGITCFCCAANLGQILRLQPRESED